MLNVAAAATLEPEIAPNTPFAASDHGCQSARKPAEPLLERREQELTAPLPENTAPMKMNMGMASSVKELSDSHAVQAICTSGLSTANTRPAAAATPIAMPISRPKTSSRSSPPISRKVIDLGPQLRTRRRS